MSKCWTCCYCVIDKYEPYLFVCSKGYLGLSDTWVCGGYEK